MQYLRLLNPQCIKVWSCLLLQVIEEKGRTCFDVPIFVAIIWGGVAGKGKMPLQKFFYQRTTEMKRGQIKKKLVDSGVQGFIYIKDWFKPMFPPL